MNLRKFERKGELGEASSAAHGEHASHVPRFEKRLSEMQISEIAPGSEKDEALLDFVETSLRWLGKRSVGEE